VTAINKVAAVSVVLIAWSEGCVQNVSRRAHGKNHGGDQDRHCENASFARNGTHACLLILNPQFQSEGGPLTPRCRFLCMSMAKHNSLDFACKFPLIFTHRRKHLQLDCRSLTFWKPLFRQQFTPSKPIG